MRSGVSCGRGSSPTTRCSRCARTRAHRGHARAKRHRGSAVPLAAARAAAAEGRWSLVEPARRSAKSERGAQQNGRAAMAQQLLARHGVITRETVAAESVAGGFSAVYQVLKAMEDAGRIRRGYFVAGLGAAQFAMPAALDLLRSMRDAPEEPRTVVMAATDPANPYGALVKWPDVARRVGCDNGVASLQSRPTRTAGSLVVLVDGHAAAYLRRGERELLLFLPEAEPLRSRIGREVAGMLLHLAATREGRRGMLIAEINGAAGDRASGSRGCSSKKDLRQRRWASRRGLTSFGHADMDAPGMRRRLCAVASRLRRPAVEVEAWLSRAIHPKNAREYPSASQRG